MEIFLRKIVQKRFFLGSKKRRCLLHDGRRHLSSVRHGESAVPHQFLEGFLGSPQGSDVASKVRGQNLPLQPGLSTPTATSTSSASCSLRFPTKAPHPRRAATRDSNGDGAHRGRARRPSTGTVRSAHLVASKSLIFSSLPPRRPQTRRPICPPARAPGSAALYKHGPGRVASVQPSTNSQYHPHL